MLYKWKVKKSALCDFCSEQDNLMHSFYQCPHIFALRQQFLIFIQKYVNPIEMELDSINILLNTCHPKPSHVVNLLMLVLKQLIYRYKCNSKI